MKWRPDPNECFEAIVIYRNFRNALLHLILSNGSKVICLNKAVTNSVEGHTLCPPEGTYAAVRIEEHKDIYRALECQFYSEEPVPKSNEKIIVNSWVEGRTFGHGTRPCGCPICYDVWPKLFVRIFARRR